jgi:hypothetical protein
VDFPVYRPEAFDNTYLDSLGALRKASRHVTEETTLAPQAATGELPPVSGHFKH